MFDYLFRLCLVDRCAVRFVDLLIVMVIVVILFSVSLG